MPPDGVFCFNDEIAIGALHAILEAGLKVPNDIAIIGAGNMRYSDILGVPLSSVDQNNKRIGDHAAKFALKAIESKGEGSPETILLPVRLVARSPELPGRVETGSRERATRRRRRDRGTRARAGPAPSGTRGSARESGSGSWD